jgi:hypothetical protein
MRLVPKSNNYIVITPQTQANYWLSSNNNKIITLIPTNSIKKAQMKRDFRRARLFMVVEGLDVII